MILGLLDTASFDLSGWVVPVIIGGSVALLVAVTVIVICVVVILRNKNRTTSVPPTDDGNIVVRQKADLVGHGNGNHHCPNCGWPVREDTVPNQHASGINKYARVPPRVQSSHDSADRHHFPASYVQPPPTTN